VAHKSDQTIKLYYDGPIEDVVAKYAQADGGARKHRVLAWGLNQPSLEEVFMRIIQTTEAQA
jgi:hypothetical protein